MTRVRAIVGGVLRSHQNTGVESAIFFKLYQMFERKTWLQENSNSHGLVTIILRCWQSTRLLVQESKNTYHLPVSLMNDKLNFVRYKDEMDKKTPRLKREIRITD